MGPTNPQVLVIQRFLPHYRKAFFDRLQQDLGDVRLGVAYARTMGRVSPPEWGHRMRGFALRLQLRATAETAILAPGVMRLVRRTSPRVAVLEDLGGIPTNLLAARSCRRLGIPYLVWGLGRIPHNPGSRLRRYLGPVIRWYYRNADGFIGYSSHAAEVYGESDKRCTVALNAARARPRDAELEATRTAIEQRGTNGSLRVVTIGRLLEQKRIDVLLRGLRATDNPRLRLQIIGEGPDETRLRRLTHELELDDRVEFHGGIYDDETKARLLRSCDLGVMPGRGGLAIQELMWHGLPVVSGPADGTERDLIQPARGFLIPRMPEEGDLAEVLERFEALPLERRRAMALDALDQVSTRANIESMSRSYLSALMPYLRGGSGSPTGA